MKEIVVISGKGGTGKTSITASFAMLGGKDIVVADCDVDAADMHLLMKPNVKTEEDFYSGNAAVIDRAKCLNCGKCASVCRFDAINLIEYLYSVSALNCEGCGYCARVCPVKVISMVEQNVGKLYISATKADNMMVHARLLSGADNSGKLVARVKKEAKQIAQETGKGFVIVDGSPGIGCPVISSLSGADFVVLVTEPTVSGLHDLKRVYELVNRFQISAGCIINKADINQDVVNHIEIYLRENNIVHLTDLPYDESFTSAMTIGQTIVEYDHDKLADLLTVSWNKIKQILSKEQQ
ncbi:MAG TPA: ATP-binding protein [Candidatus Cloacimonas acidaminovorans]|jgi:MinD superfamily P-loop ATPase|nr:ATP-binding protein [Candidatus Cloacimonas acidaminovorans]OQC56356.1 MAG: ferredoxin [Bacteroidetes bacterium ADurb.Bin013]HRU77659.1 ATP-binding protein [Rectinema sp.]HOE54595.1 ATP-binding protein [Candidatus Cloacimonas acidaminovorans]HOM78461.1 ATP-binding protein [Candidatus Cloacimonas acidaminovorans]